MNLFRGNCPCWIRKSVTVILCLFLVNSCFGQTETILKALKNDFEIVKKDLESFRNDSALVLLKTMLHQLETSEMLDSPFGLKVQLAEAEAFERDHKNEIAIEKLLYILDLSGSAQQWEVQANTYLSLARLHEKTGQKDKCLRDLRATERLMLSYQLDTISPIFFNRLSSYHRIYENQDSAKIFAQKGLETAVKFNNFPEEGTAHLLLGMLKSNDIPEEAIQHYKSAGNIWRAVEDYNGYGAIMSNLSRMYLISEDYQLALTYNDSLLIAATNGKAKGLDETWLFYIGYRLRSKIYKQLDEPDSAFVYMEKSFQTQINENAQKNRHKVIEIEKKYEAEKSDLLIKEQSQQLENERLKRLLLSGVLGLLMLIGGSFAYSYIKQRKINKKIEAQALKLKESNEDLSYSLKQQIVLKGELHHRVRNNLQLILSLLELQKDEIADPKAKESIDTVGERIFSMAAINEILLPSQETKEVKFREYLENLFTHFSDLNSLSNRPYFNLAIDVKFINIETLLPVGIILAELVTNSVKYANANNPQLAIELTMKPHSDGYLIHYKDNGPGFPNENLQERKGGLGSYILTSMIRQLQGSFETYNDNGACYKIYIKEKKSSRAT